LTGTVKGFDVLLNGYRRHLSDPGSAASTLLSSRNSCKHAEDAIDNECVLMNTARMSVTVSEIQELFDELKASRQARLRAWEILQKLRVTICDLGDISIPLANEKSFEREGQLLDRSIATCLRDRNEALRSLSKVARTYIEVCTLPERKGFLAGANHSLLTVIAEAEKFAR
jgi:hypothetical protein